MVISGVIIRVTPFRALITLLITYLLSPLPLQVVSESVDPPFKDPIDPPLGIHRNDQTPGKLYTSLIDPFTGILLVPL